MRLSRILIALPALLLLANTSLSQTTKNIATAEAAAYQARAAFAPSTATGNYDVSYQRAHWQIDPAKRYIQGAVTTYFKPLQDNFAEIWFDLDNALKVDSAFYRNQKISYEQTNSKLVKLVLPKKLSKQLLDSVTIYYQGIPPLNSDGSFVQSEHSGTPIIWTLSEPYGARDWWPCKQSLTDKIDSIDILVRTPNNFRAASNGLLVKEQAIGNEVVYHWRHRYPIVTYLVAVAVTNYTSFSQKMHFEDQEIEVLNYVYPESVETIRPQADNITGMMQLFNELFGLYPFAKEKYGHAQFGWGGGMEHQTMSFMGSFNYDLMAHELAHQWFGNKVTCGSWQDIWVNEGFATYLTGLTKEHLGSAEDWKRWKASKINSVTAAAGGSVWVPDTSSVNRIFSSRLSYNKGAYLLHMLRWVVGDAAFYQGIRNYLNDPALAYGFAQAKDVQRHLESSSGKNLDEFFADWYYGEGFPEYKLFWEQQEQLVKVKLSQTTSVPSSVSFFEMPVAVLFRNASGDQEKLVIFDHLSQDQIFETSLPFEVSSVVIDPELWLLTKNAQVTQGINSLDKALESKLKLYPNPSSTEITISAEGGLKIKEIVILDLQGKQIQQLQIKSEQHYKLNVKQLPAAMYLLRINTDKGWTVKRIAVP